MQETYQKTIKRKIKKKQMNEDSKHWRQSIHASDVLGALKKWMSTYLGLPMIMLVTEPVVLFLSLYVALNFGILYNFFPAVPWSLSRTYGFNEGQSGLAFIAISIGCLLAFATAVVFDSVLKKRTTDRSPGSRYLEQILWPAMIGSLGGPIGLFWFAWTVRPDIHWASPLCALIPFAWGNLCIFVSRGCSVFAKFVFRLTCLTRFLQSATWSTFTDRYMALQLPREMPLPATGSQQRSLSSQCRVSIASFFGTSFQNTDAVPL